MMSSKLFKLFLFVVTVLFLTSFAYAVEFDEDDGCDGCHIECNSKLDDTPSDINRWFDDYEITDGWYGKDDLNLDSMDEDSYKVEPVDVSPNGCIRGDIVYHADDDLWVADQRSVYVKGACWNDEEPAFEYASDQCEDVQYSLECYVIGDYDDDSDDVNRYARVDCAALGAVCSDQVCHKLKDHYLEESVVIETPSFAPNWMWKFTYRLPTLDEDLSDPVDVFGNASGTEGDLYIYADPSEDYLVPGLNILPSAYKLETYVFVENDISVPITNVYDQTTDIVILIENDYGSGDSEVSSYSGAGAANLLFTKGLNKINIYFYNDNESVKTQGLIITASDALSSYFKWMNHDNFNEANVDGCENGLDDDMDGFVDMFDPDCNEFIDCNSTPALTQGCCGDEASDFGKYVKIGSTEYVCIFDENNESKWVDAGLYTEDTGQILTIRRDSQDEGVYQLFSTEFSWLGCDRDSKGTFGATGGETFSGVRGDLLCYLNDLSDEQEYIASCDDLSNRIVFVDAETSGNLQFSPTTNAYWFEDLSSRNWGIYDYVEFDVKFLDNVLLNMNIVGAEEPIVVKDYLTGIPRMGEWVHVKIPTDVVTMPVTKVAFFVPPAAFDTEVTQVNIELANTFYLTADNELQYCAPGQQGVFRWITDLDDDNIEGFEGQSCEANSEAFRWSGTACCGDDLTKDNYYADTVGGCWNSLYLEEGELINATY